MASFDFIRLATKPTAQMCYRFIPASTPPAGPTLLAFVNGMGMPQEGWTDTINELQAMRKDKPVPPMLTFDRFGQGKTTDRDPNDEKAPEPSHGHDCMEAVRDLRQLLSQVASEQLHISNLDSVPLVLVANSIGGALVRLYAHEHPSTVAGLLILDSVLANSDFVSIFPDPDAEDFDAGTLPHGVTPENLRGARELVGKIFHPRNGSKEGLSRKNLAELLPASDAPALKGPDGHGPFVTVVGHNFETFGTEWAKNGMPKELVTEYVNPFWQNYNEGLVKITDPDRAKGPLQAPDADHFIQRDNPIYVAEQLDELLSKVL